MTMKTAPQLLAGEQHTLADSEIQTQARPNAAHELQTSTAIMAGRKGPACVNPDKSEMIACCNDIPHSTGYEYVHASDGWYCNYRDEGTGDWD